MGQSLPMEIPFCKLPTAFSSLQPSQILSEFELGGNKFIPLQALTNNFRTESEVDESSERQVITEERRKERSLTLKFPPMWPGFDSRCSRHMWVEFVVGSRTCFKDFSLGTPVFLPPQKPTFPISNST